MYQYSIMAPRFSSQNCIFLSILSLSINITKRDLDTKKTTPNADVCPEGFRAMLEYWMMEGRKVDIVF